MSVKGILFRAAAAVLSLVTLALLSEATLRLLSVRTGPRAQPVDGDNPVFRFLPNQPFVYSRGWGIWAAKPVRSRDRREDFG